MAAFMDKRAATDKEREYIRNTREAVKETIGKRVAVLVITDVTYVGDEYIYLDGKGVPLMDVKQIMVLRDSEFVINDDRINGHYDRTPPTSYTHNIVFD